MEHQEEGSPDEDCPSQRENEATPLPTSLSTERQHTREHLHAKSAVPSHMYGVYPTCVQMMVCRPFLGNSSD